MNLPNQLTVLRILLTPVFVVLLFSQNIAIKYVALVV
jgi:phosphatidylglycerophosphate synthase